MRGVCVKCLVLWTSATLSVFSVGKPQGEVDGQVLSLGRALENYHSGHFEKALASLKDLLADHPKNGELHYWLGKVYFQLMQPKEATGYYLNALELGVQTGDVHYGLGQAYGAWAMDASVFTQARLAGKIRRAFEAALELDPGHFDATVALMMYYEQAPGFMGGSFEKAVELGERAFRLSPAGGARAFSGMYMRKKMPDEAIAIRERLVREQPDVPEHQVSLLALLLELERFDGWPERFEAFESKFGKHPIALYQFGKYGALTGDRLDKAEQCLEQYLDYQPEEDEPSHAAACWRLGLVLEHQNRLEEAYTAISRAVAMNEADGTYKKDLGRVGKQLPVGR